jgi:apolipoprotein D and lipocalin family protein
MKSTLVSGVLTMSLLLSGCLEVPKNITPVSPFDLDRYLGKWYEIARLDHSFERGLNNVSAHYSMRPDGGVKVTNRGFSAKKNKWKEAVGKAYFVRSKNEGYLKVSFFGPFYGSYVVFELDKENYQFAFVSGAKKKYLWFLARTPTVDKELIDRFIAKAGSLGFNTDKLIFVEQDNNIKMD